MSFSSPNGKEAPEEQAPMSDRQSKIITSGATEQPGDGDAQRPGPKEDPPIETPPRQEGVYIPHT